MVSIWWNGRYMHMVGICWNGRYMHMVGMCWWVYVGMVVLVGIWWVWSIDNIPSLWRGGIFEQRA